MNVNFHNIRLPDFIEQGSLGGPRFKTTVLTAESGFEKRNIEWQDARSEYNISYGLTDMKKIQQVRDFFCQRYGRAFGFRFRDWSDYKLIDEIIGIGNGIDKVYQIYKTYGDPTDENILLYRKVIVKVARPNDDDAESVIPIINVNGKRVSVYARIDYDSGLITFSDPPADGEPITITCNFDIPVRFNDDLFASKTLWKEVANIPAIKLIELKPIEFINIIS